MKRSTLSSLITGLALASVCTISLAQTAAALDASATRAVNVRSGPGVGYSKVDVLFAGETVNITECQGRWCHIEHPGPDGWVSGGYLQTTEAVSPERSNNKRMDPALAAILGAILGAVIHEALDDDETPPTPPAPTPPAPPTPTPVLQNGIYTVQQLSNGRYLDAHLVSSDDYRVVTRNAQNNPSQLWAFKRQANGTYTIQQLQNMRYLDAHEGTRDNTIVTRDRQGNPTQEWRVKRLSNGKFTLRQKSNGRFMDAHEGTKDNDVVTRNAQGNATQQWILTRR